MDSILKIIKSTPMFEGLKPAYLNSIAAIAKKRSCKKGETIFNEGDEGNGFYVVEQGTVKIFKTSFGGKEQIFHIYGPGKPFGEVPVFTGKDFPASAVAISNTELIFFPRNDFISLITDNPSLALNILAVLSMRLHQFTVMVENLALKEVPARLASYLLILVNEQEQNNHIVKHKSSIASHNLVVTLPVSKNQLAGLLGTTPETISRVFAKFANDEIIEIDRNVVTIIDIEQLAEAAQQ
ncbi:MAG: Crp/Fnr family transcriptional regulator [Desulfamplus sp.]|nr:Crp/Fnr family transcriptional regulator [Desulfamplus sp.]MBF0412531.1 Crp/Fnr family transcriptional regulator [Desulfamplus sp.]